MIDDIDLSKLVFTEGRNQQIRIEKETHNAALQDKDFPGAVVAEHVRAEGKTLARTAVDVAARNGATAEFGGVVFRDRRYGVQRSAGSGAEACAARSFEHSPSIVAAPNHVVDFLTRTLSHIAGEKLAVQTIERKPPRVTEAECKDLIPTRNGTEEGIG
jgi:hypothetical protein